MDGLAKKSWGMLLGLIFAVVTSSSLLKAESEQLKAKVEKKKEALKVDTKKVEKSKTPVKEVSIVKKENVKKEKKEKAVVESQKAKVTEKTLVKSEKKVEKNPLQMAKKQKVAQGLTNQSKKSKVGVPKKSEKNGTKKQLKVAGLVEGDQNVSVPKRPNVIVRFIASMLHGFGNGLGGILEKLDRRDGISLYEGNWFTNFFYSLLNWAHTKLTGEPLSIEKKKAAPVKKGKSKFDSLGDEITAKVNAITSDSSKALDLKNEWLEVCKNGYTDKNLENLKEMFKQASSSEDRELIKEMIKICGVMQGLKNQMQGLRKQISEMDKESGELKTSIDARGISGIKLLDLLWNRVIKGTISRDEFEQLKKIEVGKEDKATLKMMVRYASLTLRKRDLEDKLKDLNSSMAQKRMEYEKEQDKKLKELTSQAETYVKLQKTENSATLKTSLASLIAKKEKAQKENKRVGAQINKLEKLLQRFN